MKRRTRFIIKEVFKDHDFYFAVIDSEAKSIDKTVEEYKIEISSNADEWKYESDIRSRTKQRVIARARELEFPIPSVAFVQAKMEFVE